MKTWLYLPLLLLVFVFSGCTKTTNEVVIPNTTKSFLVNPADWKYDNTAQLYYALIPVAALNNVSQSDGVVVSLGRYTPGSSAPPTSYELLPQVLNNLSYFVIHDSQQVEVDIKGINGAASAAPNTAVIIKVVVVPSVIQP